MRNIFNKKEVFSIRKFSMGAASVMITASLLVLPQGNNWQLKAKENIQVQVNKDISVNVIEKHGGAEVELIATKDVTNIDVNVMLDGNRVISYHIDSLKSGVSTKKYITKEQLDIIKKLISNGQKTLPNTAIVEKNVSQSIVLSGYNLKVDVKYHVEEEPKAEQPKVEQPKVETPKVEQPKVETPKVEQPKVEQPKVEAPKVEQPKVETPKAEQPRVETPKVEQPRVETPKVEQPKVETPKVEQPKVETPKVEQPKVEIPKVPQTIKRVEVRTETIVYKIEERNNEQLPQGTRKVVTAGKNGSYKVVRDDIYEGDKLVKQGTEQNIDRIEAVNEVVEIGTKVPQTIKRVEVRTEAIAYKIEERNNDQLSQGTRKVVTAGKNGSYKVVRDDIYEGDKLVKQGAEQNIDRIEAVNEVVEIGTKVPQTIKRVEVRTETIAYKTEERNNDQLPQGTRKVVTAGNNGSYKVVRDDIYEGEKLVKQGAEQNIDRIEAVNEVVEIGIKVPQATTDTYFVLDTENNWFVTSEQTDALTKLFGTANGNVDVTFVVEKLKDPENYKLFNKLNLGQYFNKVNNPASVQKMINDYALKNQLEINKKFIDLANVERVKAGLAPAVSAFDNVFNNVKIDKFVQDMVNERAKEMADYGSLRYLGKEEGKHKRPDGRSWYTVYSDKGIDLTGTSGDNHRYNMAGENALQNNSGDLYFLTTPDAIIKDAFDGWMASPGHRALILNDVPHPIFAFSYRQGLKDYLGSKNKPTVAILHVTSWFNPLDYPVSKEEYEKWRLDPKNKDNIVASEEYYNFLKVNTKNKATQ